jgi:hypothetical protein
MGVETYIVIGDLFEAQAIAASDDPAAGREGFSFRGFDRVQLCTLLSLMKSGGPDVEYERYLSKIDVFSPSSGEWPVVSLVPAELVAEIAVVARFEGSDFEDLAASWQVTEEFVGWLRSDVRDLLQQLGDLAESASLQGKCLILQQTV